MCECIFGIESYVVQAAFSSQVAKEDLKLLIILPLPKCWNDR